MTESAVSGRVNYVQSILLIDDNPSCNFIMREFIKLADAGILVHEAESVDEALNILGQTELFPEVVYVDLNMPVKNGFDFIEEFEAMFATSHPETKLYMLSSSLRSEDIDAAMMYASVVDFVNKNEIDSFLQATLLRVHEG
ncbi:MAG: response regulator [Cryomorphaceae bacterium]|nr:response regulator [Cryomorphaceae bacterium]